MPNLTGQLSLDGQEVSGSVLDAPGLGKVDYLAPEDWSPRRGDHIRITVEYAVEDISAPWKHNSEGVPVGNIKEVIRCRAVVPEIVQVVGVVTKQQIDQAWDEGHAGQAATG